MKVQGGPVWQIVSEHKSSAFQNVKRPLAQRTPWASSENGWYTGPRSHERIAETCTSLADLLARAIYEVATATTPPHLGPGRGQAKG